MLRKVIVEIRKIIDSNNKNCRRSSEPQNGVYSAVLSHPSKSGERHSRASQCETEPFWKKDPVEPQEARDHRGGIGLCLCRVKNVAGWMRKGLAWMG